jgi:hypothetical protein
MELVELPVGKQAAVDADCIRIEQQQDRSFTLTGSALCTGEDEGESVSLVGDMNFETVEQAKQSGLAWAETIGVDRLYVGTGTLEQPFEIMEIDRPL